MKKNLIARLIAVAMTVTTLGNTVAPMTAYALPAVEQKVANRQLVDIEYNGKTTTVVAYNIDGFNYFRIADICAALDMKVWSAKTEWEDNPNDNDWSDRYTTDIVKIKPSKQYDSGALEPAPMDAQITVSLTKKLVGYDLASAMVKGFNYKDRNWYQLNDISVLSKDNTSKIIETSYTQSKTKSADGAVGKITITTTEK